MLVLVRHGDSVRPEAGGPDDYHRPLTPTGLRQAAGLVAELVALRPVLVASSPYLRAIQTVAPLADALGLPVRTWPELREWDSGLEPSPDYERHYAAAWADPDLARPGGESLRALSTRATTILRSLARSDGTVVVGSHGTFIARALAGLGVPGIDWPFHRAMPMPALYHLTLDTDLVRAAGPDLPR